MSITVTGIKRVSTKSSGGQANGTSAAPEISPDGATLLFTSTATNLVPGVANGNDDIFAKNLSTGAVTLVSSDASGAEANNVNEFYNFSPDGTEVVFNSLASNLVPGDTNNQWDVFVKNLSTGAVTLVSTTATGTQGDNYEAFPVFSPDGGSVAFTSYSKALYPSAPTIPQILLKNLSTGALTDISSDAAGNPANQFSQDVAFSPDGTKIAFDSLATNLDGGASTSNGMHIFVKNLTTGNVTDITTASTGGSADGTSQNPVFSPDGTKVLFNSDATDLGAGRANGVGQWYVKDLATGALTAVSASIDGVLGNHASGETPAAWSPDGTMVAFATYASNFGGGDTNHQRDIYVKNLLTGEITRVTDGVDNQSPVWSPDGKTLYFTSTNAALVANDTNARADIFAAKITENHIIDGNSGNNQLQGTDVAETINGNGGNDIIHAMGGDDTVFGGSGDDTVDGNEGNDTLWGGSGNDSLLGENGDDVLKGGIGNDNLEGDNGNDNLHGGDGNDVLRGGASSDDLYGDAGDDWLFGGTGTNHLTGGSGADIFVMDADAFDGHADKIEDFSVAQNDQLLIRSVLVGFHSGSNIDDFVKLSQTGTGMTLSVDRDGAGGAYAFQDVAVLKNTSGLNVDTLYASGNITIV